MAETEKITINLSVVDLGKIDLSVEQGFYSNRSDFIRTAIRNQLNIHAEALDQTAVRKHIVIGVLIYGRRELEERRAAGEQLDMRVVGLVTLANDVTPELALATIRSLKVYGVLRASQAVRDALGERIQ